MDPLIYDLGVGGAKRQVKGIIKLSFLEHKQQTHRHRRLTEKKNRSDLERSSVPGVRKLQNRRELWMESRSTFVLRLPLKWHWWNFYNINNERRQ